MSQFLEGVRVFDVLGQSSLTRRTSDPSPASGEESYAGSPSPSPTPHKRSSDSNDAVFAAIPICAIVFTFIYLIIKAIMAPFTQRARYARPTSGGNGGGLSEEEVAVLQKLQRTLVQMESRVEALETILIEQARTEKKYGSKL